MAFLDNSGDIILDAVLTDIGRKKMADGNFLIESFALGDDEIDYALFNANHASGSAYFDLEILQTPVMEAATKQASSIKYGLMSIERTDLLFMPTMQVNQKISEAVVKHNNMFILAANTETYDKVKDLIGESKVLSPSSTTPDRSVVLETGIEDSTRTATRANRTAMLASTNLLDRNVEVKFDFRFLSGIRTATTGRFANNENAEKDIVIGGFQERTPIAATDFIENYSTAFAVTMPNLVLQRTDGTGTAQSQFAGPRGIAAAFTIVPSVEVNLEGSTTPSAYTLYGKTNRTETDLGFGSGGTKYDTIDTTVYAVGDSSGAQVQIPVRIVRLRG